MNVLKSIVAIAMGVCLAVPVAVSAQQGTADIRGRVIDQQGAVLPGVNVVVRHQESGLFREAVTGADGLFMMSAMTPGVYEVSAELSGFKKYAQRDIVLPVGGTARVELKLEVGGLTESVTVTGESPLVDTTSNEIGGRISAQEFVDTPSFNRNFAGYLGMLPGVVATISATTFGADSVSVAGQDVRNVNYTMDGSNNNDTFNGGNGGAQARVPVEAVQEFQFLTSQCTSPRWPCTTWIIPSRSSAPARSCGSRSSTWISSVDVSAFRSSRPPKVASWPPSTRTRSASTPTTSPATTSVPPSTPRASSPRTTRPRPRGSRSTTHSRPRKRPLRLPPPKPDHPYHALLGAALRGGSVASGELSPVL